MKKINGYTIIAHRPYSHGDKGLVILGVRSLDKGYEYVSAVVDTLDDRDWSWGHYTPNNLDTAVKDFNER